MIALKEESVTIHVNQDEAIQWSPGQSSSREGMLYLLSSSTQNTMLKEYPLFTYQPVQINSEAGQIKKKMMLQSSGLQDCSTIVIHDTTKNIWLVTHISPYSIRKTVGITAPSLFDQNFDAHSKTAIVDFEEKSYLDKNLGIGKDSKLEIVVIKNHKTSDEAHRRLEKFLKNKFPNQIEKYNLITTQVMTLPVSGAKGSTVSLIIAITFLWEVLLLQFLLL